MEQQESWDRAKNELKKLESKKAQLQQDLVSKPSEKQELETELEKTEIKIEETRANIQNYEEEIQRLGGDTNRRQSDKKEESKRLFDKAMEQGYILLHTNNVMLMGVAGSGKTSLKDLLLGNPPKEERTSTPLMDRILHVRPVTNSLIKSSEKTWKELNQSDMIHLLAQAVKHLPLSSSQFGESPSQSSKFRQILNGLSGIWTYLSTLATFTSGTSTPLPSVTQTINAVVNDVIEAMASMSSQVFDSNQQRKGTELFGTKTMRIMDNGGQPQFQDIAPLFIRHTSVGLFVMRLIDDFNDYPCDDLYKDGKLVGTPSPSHLTHGETIISLLRSFLSCSQNPRFIFVGTFLDELKEKESEIVSDRNKMLLEMLSSAKRNEVVYSNSGMNKVIFTLNARCREKNTLSVAEKIREAVEESPSLDIEVPLWWFVIELSLLNLSSKLGRGILRKCECVELAQSLRFDQEALEAALEYFDDMCIVHYYPEILPDIVFVDPQVPLNKVSELTKKAISLREARGKESGQCAVFSEWKRFRDEGIFKINMLESKEFQKHYEKGLFSAADMIAIMRELMIIAPLSLGKADCQQPETEFFMPTLLRSVSPFESEKHRVLDSSADPLLIRFDDGCIRRGIFCCLVVYLMKTCGWQMCLSSGEAALLARNCVKLKYPKYPGSITLIDSFSCIEVHVKAHLPVCKELCPVIKMHVISGVKQASKSLHYNDNDPEIAIFCPHTSSKQGADTSISKRHYAEVDLKSGYWCCLTESDYDGALENKHTIWFDNQSSLKEFSDTDLRINQIAKEVGINIQDLDKPCSQHHLLPISQHLEHWSSYGDHLGLTRVEITSIKTDIHLTAHHARGLEMLMTWQRKCGGISSKASYRHLLRGCVEINNDLDVVRYICNLIKSKD